jgi:hypothetical protein
MMVRFMRWMPYAHTKAYIDVRNGRVSDAKVWATYLKSYPVELEDDTGDISVNRNGSDNDKYNTK